MLLPLFQDAQSEEEQAALQHKTTLLSQFWSTATSVIRDTPSGSMLRDVAQLELSIVMDDVPSTEDAKVYMRVYVLKFG